MVTPQSTGAFDVAIKGESIAAVTAPGALGDDEAGRVIDAAGKIVMPGGIDPHVHMHHPWIKPDGIVTLTSTNKDGRLRVRITGTRLPTKQRTLGHGITDGVPRS